MSNKKQEIINNSSSDSSLEDSEPNSSNSSDELIDIDLLCVNKQKKYTLEEILVENSEYDRCHLKKRLLDSGLLENKCSKCGLDPKWRNMPLSLQLDHINGINNDNRLENLRMLCPNCHSQTSTFTGKNIKKKSDIPKIREKKECTCGNKITKQAKECKECSKKTLSEKNQIFVVTKDELENMLVNQKLTRGDIAKKYGVSKATVSNRCREYGMPDARKKK